MDTEDIVFQVFTFIPLRFIPACRVVCKLWNEVCSADELWRIFVTRDIGVAHLGTCVTWHDYYKSHSDFRFEEGPWTCPLLSVGENGRLVSAVGLDGSACVPRALSDGRHYWEVEIVRDVTGYNIVIGVTQPHDPDVLRKQQSYVTWLGWNYCTINQQIYHRGQQVPDIDTVAMTHRGGRVGVYLDMTRAAEGRGRIAFRVCNAWVRLISNGSPWVCTNIPSPVHVSVDLTGSQDIVRFHVPSLADRPHIDFAFVE